MPIMRFSHCNRAAILFLCYLLALNCSPSFAQQGAATGPPLVVKTAQLPKGYFHRDYRMEMHADGGITPLRWKISSGSLPPGITLTANGVVQGSPTKTGEFSFAVTISDSGIPVQQITKSFTLLVVTPLVVRWGNPPKVNGMRVDGSIKVSNQTGEDFDLTMVVLAVNENGRATAIGYQHFPLKQGATDLLIPFGENLPYGTYSVNVDVVGEVASSNSIYRARLATRVTIVQPT